MSHNHVPSSRPVSDLKSRLPLHIAMASPEISPFARSGGLGEVLGSLPLALEKLGLRISLIMPAYRSVFQGNWQIEDTGMRITVPISNRNEEGTVFKTRVGKAVDLYFIRADKYYDRESLYCGLTGDYADNAERFIFFSRAVLEVLKYDPPSILHAHDWQSALSIVFLKTQPELYPKLASIKTLFTIHNLGFQGRFWKWDWHLLNLDSRFFTPQYLEFYDDINFLKGALVFSDAVNTVSPTHAEEIKTPEFGFGLEGVLGDRAKDLYGILNGIDYQVWNPETDEYIIRTFSGDDLTGKVMCKTELQRAFSLDEDSEALLIAFTSRLTPQKGVEIVQKAADEMLSRKVQFILVGSNGKEYQEFFRGLEARYPGKVGIEFAFDEALVHQVIAGSDLLLLPSLYEPCGLTQIEGLKYGTPSIVRATGGLNDTIQEFNAQTGQGTGFVFKNHDASDFVVALDRALSIYQNKKLWMTLMKNGMKADFSWKRSAQAYKNLYLKLIKSE